LRLAAGHSAVRFASPPAAPTQATKRPTAHTDCGFHWISAESNHIIRKNGEELPRAAAAHAACGCSGRAHDTPVRMSTSVQTDCRTWKSTAEPRGAAHLRPNVDGPHMLRDKVSCAAKQSPTHAIAPRTSACDDSVTRLSRPPSARCRRKGEGVPAKWVGGGVRAVCRLHSDESRRVRVPRHGVVPMRPTVV
jgi:hypothetical protein